MRKSIFAVLAAAIAVSAITIAVYSYLQSSTATEYNPVINPADFAGDISNKYFTLKPGTKFIYRNGSGSERTEILVTRETKEVMGVKTIVVRATGWKNGELKEDTRDWYAQDKQGNVWYFGETVDNYTNGKVSDHAGSWEAGIDGAKPGIIMLARPKVGETYRQEYYKGKAEDMGTVVALDTKVTTPAGTFENCLKIKDWSRITWATEYKYHCPVVGFVVLAEPVWFGERSEELIAVSDEN